MGKANEIFIMLMKSNMLIRINVDHSTILHEKMQIIVSE